MEKARKTSAKICAAAILCVTLWACGGSRRAAQTAIEADTLREATAREYIAISRQLEAIASMRLETRETVLRDSTVIVLGADGQTLSRETYRIRDTQMQAATAVDRTSARADTAACARLDSVAATSRRAEAPTAAERRLTAWERLRLRLFAPLAAVALALAAWACRKPLLALARRLI